MKKLSPIFKVGVLLLFTAIFFLGCKKAEDPNVNLNELIKRYVVESSIADENPNTPKEEAALIKEWLVTMVENNEKIDTTSSGLSYIVEKVGAGEAVKAGKEVTVKYIGFFTNGIIFDASAYHGDGTMTYVHKVDNLISGWEEGIAVLQKGGRAAFLIPSSKAYGTKGNSSIPPNSPLIFVIEVVTIK